MKHLKTETLQEFIVSWANHQLAYGRETTCILDDLRTDFGMTDRDILDLGLDHLFPDDDPDEQDENPLRVYSFCVTAHLDTVIEVAAHSEEEANDLVEKEIDNLNYDEMDCYECGYE